MDAPYKDEYCCEVIANGKWVDANPDTAARATRALLKGAKWVETNPRAAAVMAVEKKYLASTPELNTVALARLRYIPSVQLAEESVHICRPRNESRQDAFSRDRHRSAGETRFHASSRRDGRVD